MSIYLLSDTHHKGVINLPQIEPVYRDIKIDLSSYEALIFSSKNAVKAINKINKNWCKIPSYAIGKQTANMIEEKGGRVEFIASSSYGDSFAREVSSKLQNKKTLFLRAKKVVSDLENILKKSGVDISSIIVYETLCRQKITLHVEDEKKVFIFTSPSTVDCFFSNYEWQKNYSAVCIGEVTARAVPLGISLHISNTQTIEACIELAKTIIKQN